MDYTQLISMGFMSWPFKRGNAHFIALDDGKSLNELSNNNDLNKSLVHRDSHPMSIRSQVHTMKLVATQLPHYSSTS